MNYLAHIFLSGDDTRMQVGNFIGDFVKGNRFVHYPDPIRRGILLHRKIDSFTDTHPVVRETIGLLRPHFGRYSGIVADMYFDYFLAVDFHRYHDRKSLRVFAFQFYFSLLINYRYLPPRVRSFVFHFVFTNRLSQYATPAGLKSSLEIMAAYKVSALSPDRAVGFLVENHDDLQERFHAFFPQLVDYVKNMEG